MKSFLPLFTACSFIAFFGTGCSTPNPDGTVTTKVDIVALAADLKDVSREATSYIVEGHPADRAKFEQAVLGLKSLEASGTVTSDSIISALNAAGIEELQSRDARLAVTGGRILFRRVLSKSSVVIDENFLPVAVAIRQGIEQGLRLTP
jgi:hypothetical protein